MNNSRENQIMDAANHFTSLYDDEIQNGEPITKDAIYEWWTQSVDQFSELSLDDSDEIEKAIFKKI